MKNDIAWALKQLEAQDRERATPSRRAAERSVEFARLKLETVRSSGEKVIDLAERRGVSYVENATALGRRVQGAAADDAFLALEHIGRLAASKSPAEAVAAQVDYVRAQTRVGMERWRALAVVMSQAAGSAARTLEDSLRRFER
ncbi:phasin family protein [Methylopila sp. M107]|uniref:phasin family protein n=1 Tax=Methylopila sp. M107 TaxID=1101190 RepID=UPI000379A630|nr:phasin family protein [Methylopila sp. M107]